MIKLTNFTWSEQEQIYPLEKDKSNRTLYCKEINCGNLPNTGSKTVNMNIVNFDHNKVFWIDMQAVYVSSTGGQTANFAMPSSSTGTAFMSSYQTFANGTLYIETNNNFSIYTAIFRIIYAKL